MTRSMNFLENVSTGFKGFIVCYFSSLLLKLDIGLNDVLKGSMQFLWLGLVALFTGVMTVIGKKIGEWFMRKYFNKSKKTSRHDSIHS